ncbi:MAG: toll/interleukin-1 receptor domain-containing protein [Phycisphaerales bacterium]
MERHRKLIVLIGAGSRPRLVEIEHFLRPLFEDLHNAETGVLPFPPVTPRDWDDWHHSLHGLDVDRSAYLFHRWIRGDQLEFPPVERDELIYMLHRIRDLCEFVVLVVLTPLAEGGTLTVEQLADLLWAIEPSAIVDLNIGEGDRRMADRVAQIRSLDTMDRPMADRVPEVRSFDYPEERGAFLQFLRSFTEERAAIEAEARSARLATARLEFANRTADQERPKITAAYPEAMAPSCWSTMEVFLYLRSYRRLVEAEIRRLQNREGFDYSGLSSEFPRSLPSGCPIRICLQSDELRTNPSEMTINWYEPYNRLPFRVSPISRGGDEYLANLNVDVFADDLPVASMQLAIAVTSNALGERTSPAESDAAWYEDIFASYAREDLELVKHLKERYEALGLYMFIDLDDLRAGASWETVLFERIDSSDLFQLFWSKHARKSRYVREEWQHALSVSKAKGGRFIRPVYWQEPIPRVPKALAGINFRRINFVESRNTEQES